MEEREREFFFKKRYKLGPAWCMTVVNATMYKKRNISATGTRADVLTIKVLRVTQVVLHMQWIMHEVRVNSIMMSCKNSSLFSHLSPVVPIADMVEVPAGGQDGRQSCLSYIKHLWLPVNIFPPHVDHCLRHDLKNHHIDMNMASRFSTQSKHYYGM